MAYQKRSSGALLLLLGGCAIFCVNLAGLQDPGFVQPGPRGGMQQQPVRSTATARQFFGNPLEAVTGGPTVVIKEDYTMAALFLSLGALLSILLPYAAFGFGAFLLLLGGLFYFQTGRVRFVFDGEAMEVKTTDFTSTTDGEPELKKTGENIVVGGENRWKYNTFVNYEFFPKGLVEQGLPPVLVYFKETQTPQEQWNEGPGASANSPEALAKGAKAGQVHFFPCVCDAQQIKAEFEKRGCAKIVTPED
eukprot:CAMPEP_0178415182 /NCGR_PEP_ID=MMETSP0689_2-20121128/23421_1 /TAXON_ID=160604 /ORGANISM="Amphidinium massartii, Strain CS-259" /LENGTH=248 /DNA_ID=CAMNT_0020036497 /DNA_START=95 /DNA_END=841 /DNA_ORIENTATION=+